MSTPDVFPIFTKAIGAAGPITSVVLPASGVKLAGGFPVKLNPQGRIASLPSGLTAMLAGGNTVKLAGGLKAVLQSGLNVELGCDVRLEDPAECTIETLTQTSGTLATAFNGDVVKRGGGWTGAADSKSGSFSFFVFRQSDGGGLQQIMDGDTALGVTVAFLSNNKLFIRFTDTPVGTICISMTSTNTILNADGWVHCCGAWDVAAGKSILRVNRVDDKTLLTLNDLVCDYTKPDWSMGSNLSGSSNLDAHITAFYLNFGRFIDWDVSTQLDKVVTTGLLPAVVNADGSSVDGTVPLVWLPFGDPRENGGSGGSLTVTSGALETVVGPGA